MSRLRVATFALAVAAAAVAAAAVAAPGLVVRGDRFIGSFAVKKDGTLGGVVRAFGRPTSLKRTRDGCVGNWRSVGLTVSFYNLGGQDPCKPRTGLFADARMTGPGWRTDRGLHVGDTVASVKQLYPKAQRHGLAYWLVPRFTQATGAYGGLSALVSRGRVAAFEVIYGAGGD